MSSPIKDVLLSLSRHAEVIEHALSGVISAETGTPRLAISALRQASALLPAGEDGYRLHTKLREYLHSHLQLYPAFQSLAEIGSRISQVNSLWTELELVHNTVDKATANDLLESLQTTVFDIGDSMDSNMLLLQTLLSTRYGNVKSLEFKKRQNRYYQQQTAALAADLARLSKVCDIVEREASSRAMEGLARFIRRNILPRIMPWQHGLSEMQTHLSKEIFRIREVERNHMLLARLDMMLRQQPAWRGIDADLSQDIPDFLLAASLPAMVAHVEPMEADRSMLEEMESLARDLPPKRPFTMDAEAPKRYIRIVDPPNAPQPSAAALALKRLTRDVNAAEAGVSLITWRDSDTDALSLAPNVWLVFAIMALRSLKMNVQLVANAPRDGERFAHTFRDAVATSKAAMATQHRLAAR
ncbi:hypothetical protein Rfer_4478 (plasmid) [Rhodoferax ferrireducens T118]|uniref:Uncharacterized protein n=1 Tax=Albidiferax ferrireducens (strain ATCC BAA-621 / DSM 15236 / T118) TaxID=338969 RepID=Q21PY1_ALBFT|nr:hypothetical protein [Rhodoferax ferrireducens]ABD72164.1 hypothetical protein Rfer_4478 [Rhodoferax ferrireducens T118]